VVPRPPEPSRQTLSYSRLLVALAMLAGAALGALYGVRTAITDRAAASLPPPWFAPYVDVTLTPTYQFQIPSNEPARQVVLGFVVAGRARCTPAWGGVDDLAQADSALSLDGRLAQLRQEGVGAVISFGGQSGTDLALACSNPASLAEAYASVVDRYRATTIDLDIEGRALSDWSAVTRRAAALSRLEAQVRRQHRRLAVWLTLPVEESGLDDDAQAVIREMLRDHVTLAGVDVMAMDFGPPVADMAGAAKRALDSTEAQLARLYPRYGVRLSAPRIWHTLGMTVMIGENDDAGEQLTVAGAGELSQFARSRHLGRVSLWSLNRDDECGSDFGEIGVLSPTCSGVAQTSLQFDSLFAELPGSAAAVAGQVTSLAPNGSQISLADSPYPVWQPADPYPAGYKVVWLGNVYQAKWYNQGEDPAADVQYSWQTPWLLIGPVLPGEHAPTTTTLAAGTYAAWSPSTTYRAGQRVLYGGLPYRAKWFNQAESPAAAASDPSGSPWQPLYRVPGEPSGSSG
jgi:chitinase